MALKKKMKKTHEKPGIFLHRTLIREALSRKPKDYLKTSEQLTWAQTKEFLNKLIEYDWPGNVRELENTVRKAIAFAKTPYLTSYDLDLHKAPPSFSGPKDTSFTDPLRNSVRNLLNSRRTNGNVYSHILKEAERILLEEALNSSGWNRSKAARLLGINRLTLRRKLEEYGLTFPKSLT